MVVIDEEEYNDLMASAEIEAGETKTKFKKDKFYMKDMDLTKHSLSQEAVNAWLDWFEHTMPDRFKRNTEFKNIEAIPLVELRPSFYTEQEAIDAKLKAAEVAEARMKEAEKFAKQRRKDRLKLFDMCIKQYLNSECNANYKVKYDISDVSYREYANN